MATGLRGTTFGGARPAARRGVAMVKAILAVATLAAASGAAAQAAQTAPATPPAQQPTAQPAPPLQPPPPAAPGSQSTAGSQGASSAAQPSSPGASSQQVVVNPPQPVPPSSTTVVNPSAPPTTVVTPPPPGGEVVVVERRPRPNPVGTVATDSAYGGVAGLLVGFGVALVDEFDDWERNLMVGAGVGLLAGAAFGVGHAAYDAREDRRARRVAFDGMNRTKKDPVVTASTVGVAFRF